MSQSACRGEFEGAWRGGRGALESPIVNVSNAAANSAGPLHCLVRQDRSLLAIDAPSHDTFESTSGQDIDSNGYGACRSISAMCSEQLTIADMAKPVATASLTSFCKVDVREVARS